MAAENITTLLISLVALGAIALGYVRGRAYGKLGILAWLQSVLLMAPWLLFFGLFAFGIYLNFVAVLVLFVLATAAYIYVGRQMRALGQNELIRQRLERLLEKSGDAATEPSAEALKTGTDGAISVEAPQKERATAELNPIPAEDLAAIKSIFGIDTFFATESIPYQEGAIFKGNLRGEPVETLKRLEASLKERLGDVRYRLYLINGPEDRPVVIALPTRNEPQPASTGQWVLAAVLWIATLVTCLERGGLQSNFDIFAQPDRWTETLPIGLSLMAVLICHEAGHWFMARRHGVRLGPSFLLPAWQLGSFGGLTRIESILPNRSVLFDIAFAGPAAGGVLSLLFLVLGLFLSPQSGHLPIPAEILQGSLLVGILSRSILGDALQAATIPIHPFVVVGWLGLVITALNLIPAGQLDGGRMIQAVYGRKLAGRATFVSLVGLAIFSLGNPIALYWSVLVLFLQRQPERPSQEELTEPDDNRAALCLLALFLMLTVLLPLSPALAGRLGIGLETSPALML